MRLNDLIDWFRGWCPRETLLGEPRLQRVSLDVLPLRRLLREHPLGVLLTVLSLTAGLGGFLVPQNFMPAKAEVWILTGPSLSLYDSGGCHILYAVACTPPYKDFNESYAIVEIYTENGRTRTEGVPTAMASTSLSSHNITLIGDAGIGYNALPEWRKREVDMVRGGLHYNVYLSKDG